MTCLFCKIIEKEIPAEIVYEDEKVLAFRDINPQAPVHLLIIPKVHIATLNDLTAETAPLAGYILHIASKLAKEFNIEVDGYRVVMNCNSQAGQTVFHLHAHLLGGREMSWPPG